jgi:dolichyl-phosphate-mannose-protein mannosyltransferase
MNHSVPFLIMGRVTYVHHYVRLHCLSSLYSSPKLIVSTQLPTLYFSVLMLAHLLDHFIFSSRRYTPDTKAIWFGICAFSIVGTFWWFKGMAFGIDGPIAEHTGLLWRNVGVLLLLR